MSTPLHSYGLRWCWIILIGILATSCEEQTDWELREGDLNTIVVDAVLTNELTYQVVRLTQPIGNQNDAIPGVGGAYVRIGVNGNFVEFIELGELPGTYRSPEPMSASVTNTYELQVEYEDVYYSAEAEMIPVFPTQEPSWIYHADLNLYSIQWPAGQYNPLEQAMYEAIISWDHLVDPSLTDTVTRAKMVFYSFSTIDVSYNIFPQDKEEVYFPANSIAIVRKYALNEGYADYLRALVAETEWQGSLFEDARGNLPTNISNGGLGYFSACSVLSDTLIVF